MFASFYLAIACFPHDSLESDQADNTNKNAQAIVDYIEANNLLGLKI